MIYPSPPEPGWDRGEFAPRPPIRMQASGPGAARSSPLWARLAAIVAVALVAGVVGGLTAHQLDQARQQGATAASPTPVPSPSQVAGPALDVSGIVARAEPAIATIHGQVAQGFTTGTVAGTGIVITSDGEVLTNAHVVHGAANIQVTIGGSPHPAQVVGANTAADVALLRVSGVSGLATAALDTSADVHVGDDVVAIGNALDMPGSPSVTRGIVSGTDRSFETSSGTMTGLIQTDAPISSGSSGGALLNARGQVIGITTMTAASTRGASAENVNFAIPIARAVSIAGSFGARS
jgi:S1-C subfamily serine protease